MQETTIDYHVTSALKMADASEDLLGTAEFQNGKSPYSSDPTASSELDDIVEDESTPDYRFVTSKIPSRGIKDFEPHGTQLQTSTLELSREAMFNVIREERTYVPGSVDRAVYDPQDGGAWCANMGGKWATSVGKARRIPLPDNKQDQDAQVEGGETDLKQKKPKFLSRLYLLPEEVLWLLERGSIDLRWPADSIEEEFSGMPMSLQAAHATLIGGSVHSQLTLDNFTVYQYLRRAGYVVFRAEDNWDNVPQSLSLFKSSSLVSLLDFWRHLFTPQPESQEIRHQRQILGPLVKPGLYRDYSECNTSAVACD
jgi:tRNA-splicing endonuclease subunit Sen54